HLGTRSWRASQGTRRSGGSLFHECQNIARAGDTLGPRPVEISGHVFEFFRGKRGVEPLLVGELINSVVHALLCIAPEAPRLLAFENPNGPRQMVGRVPLVEFRSQPRSNDCTNHEERYLGIVRPASCRACARASPRVCCATSPVRARSGDA